MEDPQAQAEATRKSMSLFARSEDLNEHKEQLEANAHMIGGSLTVTCVFPQSDLVNVPHASFTLTSGCPTCSSLPPCRPPP